MTIHCEGDYRRAEQKIAALEAENDDLRYQVAHWRREAGQLADRDRVAAIRSIFSLNGEEATVCAALYQRRQRFLSAEAIEGLLDEELGRSTEASLVSQIVTRIRRKIGHDGIQNERGRGYRLSDARLADLDRKLPIAT